MKPALFRIRDASGNWVEIPALIGRKGDPGTPATHRWEGTTLYITSESGTTSANLIGPQGDKGEKGDKGDPFTIAKVYDSVEAMNQGYATDGVPIGGFVAIETGDVNDEDNAKLYIKGATAYEYLTDLSGAQGLTGPQGEQGPRGEQGPAGDSGVFVGSADGTPLDTAQVWIVADGDYGHVEKWKFTPADGEPIEKNIIVPPDQALVGIKFRTENGGWVEVPALVGKDGENGISVTHVWNGTVLTLTSASGTTMTDLVGPQGERGHKGDPGERGERGYNGVHVGSDDPPEGTNVWIDTGGDYGYIEEWEFTKEGSNEVIPKKVIIPPENAIVGLRLKQPDGTWVDVPALIGKDGEKGDPGPTGPEGPVGPAGSDANVTTENIVAALGYTPADKSKCLPTSGGTMTGPITIGQGTGKGIELGEAGEIKTGSNTVLGVDTPNGAIKIGSSGHACNIRGSGERPSYNGKPLALKSDIPTVTKETWKFTLEDGTVVQKEVHIG